MKLVIFKGISNKIPELAFQWKMLFNPDICQISQICHIFLIVKKMNLLRDYFNQMGSLLYQTKTHNFLDLANEKTKRLPKDLI